MPDNHGIIFPFDRKEDHAFWMHNTCIPLDMLFIDDDGFIVGVEEHPDDERRHLRRRLPLGKYVLELNAGWTRKHGVVAGQKVKLDGL